jgi:hypothetical protein
MEVEGTITWEKIALTPGNRPWCGGAIVVYDIFKEVIQLSPAVFYPGLTDRFINGWKNVWGMFSRKDPSG